LIYGLNLKAIDHVDLLVEKGVEVERLGFHILWTYDLPILRYTPLVASAIASKTEEIRIGLGFTPLLHSLDRITNILYTLTEMHGERFEICLIPGDKNRLHQVGIPWRRFKGVVQRVREEGERLRDRLEEWGLKCRIWLGAQGPRMLGIASSFNGVQLNLCNLEMVKWGLEKLGGVRDNFSIGIIASSYIYRDFDEEMYDHLRRSSIRVARAASKEVVKAAGVGDALKAVEESGEDYEKIDGRTLDLLVEKFTITMPTYRLGEYLSKIEGLEIESFTFSTPQDLSLEAIRDLASALPLKPRSNR